MDLVNTGIQVNNGAILSGAYIVSPENVADREFFFYNHQLDQRVTISLNRLFNNSGVGAFICLLLLTLLCAFKSYMAATAFASYPSLLWYFLLEVLQLLIAVFAMIIIPVNIYGKSSGQKSVFVSKGIPRIIELCKEQAYYFKESVSADDKLNRFLNTSS